MATTKMGPNVFFFFFFFFLSFFFLANNPSVLGPTYGMTTKTRAAMRKQAQTTRDSSFGPQVTFFR